MLVGKREEGGRRRNVMASDSESARSTRMHAAFFLASVLLSPPRKAGGKMEIQTGIGYKKSSSTNYPRLTNLSFLLAFINTIYTGSFLRLVVLPSRHRPRPFLGQDRPGAVLPHHPPCLPHHGARASRLHPTQEARHASWPALDVLSRKFYDKVSLEPSPAIQHLCPIAAAGRRARGEGEE